MAAVSNAIEEARARSAEFQREGVVHLKGALDPRSLQLLRDVFDYDMAHPGAGANRFYPESGATFYVDTFNAANWHAFRQALEETPVPDIVAALWGVDDVWFFYEQIFLKEGGDMRRTPWHQDSSYLPVDGPHQAVVWITFDHIPRADALEFVPGSHQGTLYNTSAFDASDDTAPGLPGSHLERLPDIEANRDAWTIAGWDYEPGDLLIFHMGMLHGGAPTHPGTRRRTVSLRFFGPDATYAPRVPPRPEDESAADRAEREAVVSFAQGLRPGDPFRNPLFPKVRPLPGEHWPATP